MRKPLTLAGTSADMHSRRSREELINCYLETDNNQTFIRISRVPQFVKLNTIGDGPIRGMYEANGLVYIVSGTEFYRCIQSPFGALTPQLKGTVSGNTGPITMASVGADVPQILVLTSGTGYIYKELDDSFTEITDPSFTPDYTVTSFNSRFWLNRPDSNEFFGSEVDDGLNYDALFYASADNVSDVLVATKAFNTELLQMGSKSIERWQDINIATGFPLRRVQGGTINRGVASARSIAQWESTLFWLADDLTIRSLNNSGMGHISDLSFETEVSNYAAPGSCIGFVVDYPYYKCYIITFLQDNVTWCYDIVRKAWHKRKSTDVAAWRVGSSLQTSNRTLLGDRFNGNVYGMDNTVYTEDGVITPMVFVTAPTRNDASSTTYSYLELIADMGVGGISNVNEIGQIKNSPIKPMISCARSIDGGFNYRWLEDRTLGAVGNRNNKIIWRDNIRVPRGNDLVHKFMASGDFPVNIYGAFVDAESGLV